MRDHAETRKKFLPTYRRFTRKPPISRQKFSRFRMISHYYVRPHIPTKFGGSSPLLFGVISDFMRRRRVYAMVETAIFRRCGIFRYTLPYTTLEVNPWKRRLQLLATDVSMSTVWLLVMHKYSAATSTRQPLFKPWPRPIVQHSLVFVQGSQGEQLGAIQRKRTEGINDL